MHWSRSKIKSHLPTSVFLMAMVHYKWESACFVAEMNYSLKSTSDMYWPTSILLAKLASTCHTVVLDVIFNAIVCLLKVSYDMTQRSRHCCTSWYFPHVPSLSAGASHELLEWCWAISKGWWLRSPCPFHPFPLLLSLFLSITTLLALCLSLSCSLSSSSISALLSWWNKLLWFCVLSECPRTLWFCFLSDYVESCDWPVRLLVQS